MSTRRIVLKDVTAREHTHAGLWLDRYAENLEDRGPGKQAHFQELLSAVRVPELYPSFFERWRDSVSSLPPHTATRVAKVVGRMVVGLGAESVLETSVALHRTYGVPYIPGSALKGLAASAAHRLLEGGDWKKADKESEIGPAHKVMFGDKASSGCVTFHDALWFPEEDQLPLDLDVMTVHHPDYYGGQDKPPADWDSPTPVAFLTARGSYLLAVTGPKDWAEAALEILSEGLIREGIGAKTAAGYGRMSTPGRERVVIAPPPGAGGGAATSTPQAPSWRQKVAQIEIQSAGQDVAPLLDSLPPAERRLAALEIIKKIGRKKVRDKAGEKRDWAVRLLAETAEEGSPS